MSGMILHGTSFKQDVYKGQDGNQHTELIAIEGDFITLTNKTWHNIMDLCEAHGISRTSWPSYASAIDVSLDDVYEKNILLKDKLRTLPESAIQISEWLQRIMKCIKDGEMIVYVEM